MVMLIPGIAVKTLIPFPRMGLRAKPDIAVSFNEAFNLVRQQGLRQHIALVLMTLLTSQEIELTVSFDPFGNGLKVEASRHIDDGSGDGGILSIMRDVADE